MRRISNDHNIPFVTLSQADNANIFEGYLWYIVVVAVHIFILLSASLLQFHVLCNSGQNIHDCSVAGVIQGRVRNL